MASPNSTNIFSGHEQDGYVTKRDHHHLGLDYVRQAPGWECLRPFLEDLEPCQLTWPHVAPRLLAFPLPVLRQRPHLAGLLSGQ